MPNNFLSVEKEKTKEEALKEKNEARWRPAMDVKKSAFVANEEKLRRLAAEEKERRQAGAAPCSSAAFTQPSQPKAPKSQPSTAAALRPDSAASVLTTASEESPQDAHFRAALSKASLGDLKRFCGETGLPDTGNKDALVSRLVAHARARAKAEASQMAAARSAAERPPRSGGSTASARPDTGGSQPPPTALSVASLSLEPPGTAGSARPATGQSVQSFVAATAFSGGKAGTVFKKDARGLGYYRDA